MDSQSVKTTSVGGVRGYDGGKKLSGRKRHLLVDTLGLVLTAKVHTADIHDRAAVSQVLDGVKETFRRLLTRDNRTVSRVRVAVMDFDNRVPLGLLVGSLVVAGIAVLLGRHPESKPKLKKARTARSRPSKQPTAAGSAPEKRQGKSRTRPQSSPTKPAPPLRRKHVAAPRAFISFQMEDKWARDFLIQRAKDKKNDIEFYDYSVHEPFDEKWKTNCKARIAQTKGTIVLIGPTSYKAEAVLWEIAETKQQDHPIFGIQINNDKTYTAPEGVSALKIIRWNFDSIVSQLSAWT